MTRERADASSRGGRMAAPPPPISHTQGGNEDLLEFMEKLYDDTMKPPRYVLDFLRFTGQIKILKTKRHGRFEHA